MPKDLGLGHLGQVRDRTEGVEYLPKVLEEAETA